MNSFIMSVLFLFDTKYFVTMLAVLLVFSSVKLAIGLFSK